jgi:hypothetical protein
MGREIGHRHYKNHDKVRKPGGRMVVFQGGPEVSVVFYTVLNLASVCSTYSPYFNIFAGVDNALK